MKSYWLYIMASSRNGTLYVGVTSNLPRRVYEHKEKLLEGFTKKYSIDKLVYAEEFKYINDAIYREKCIKKWNRAWKIKLIEKQNTDWNDLYDFIFYIRLFI